MPANKATVKSLQDRQKSYTQCVGCGTSKRFAHLNVNGQCEDCSIVCDECHVSAELEELYAISEIGWSPSNSPMRYDWNLCWTCLDKLTAPKGVK